MAQYIISETFADDTGFKAGLSPVITIRRRDEKNNVYENVVSDTMTDVLTALGVINVGVQKASKLIPHSTDLS